MKETPSGKKILLTPDFLISIMISKRKFKNIEKQNGRTISLPVNLDPKISKLPLKAEITTLFSLKIKVSVLTPKSLIVQMPWLTTGKQ